MTRRKEQDGRREDRMTGKKPAGTRQKAQEDDPCRCKEVSVMTPRQLLGTMMSDLAFWKKKRKE